MSQARPNTPHTDPDPRLSHEIIDACRSLGFERAGIVGAAASSHPDAFRHWLAEGRHGSMDWMTEHTEARLDIRRLAPGVRSVIMVTDRYAAPASPPEDGPAPSNATGRVAKYALGRDYHAVFRKRLGALADRLRERFPGAAFRLFSDTGPVLEREQAARAGLGFIGRNTMLIDPQAGSYFLLGGIATTLDLAPCAPEGRRVSIDAGSHCGECTRCIDACPTGAISAAGVDARRCISYLTIEHEGPIDPVFHRAMGGWVFGCDVCQDVCPFNAPANARGVSVNPAYRPRPGLEDGRIGLMEVLNWTPETRQAVLTVSAGKRASLEMMRRNAVIAVGNLLEERQEPELLERVRAIAGEPLSDSVARGAALAVLSRLDQASSTGRT